MPFLFNALRTVLFAFHASYIASQLYSAKSRVVLPSAALRANKISLKPKDLITLLIYQKYHSVQSTEYHLLELVKIFSLCLNFCFDAVFIRSVLDTHQKITFSHNADRNFPYSFF